MSIGFLFWLIMVLWILFVLFFLQGWSVFGFAIQGPGIR